MIYWSKKPLFVKRIGLFFILIPMMVLSILVLKLLVDNKEKLRMDAILAFSKHSHFEKTKIFFLNKIKTPYKNINHKFKKGETIQKILINYNVDEKEVAKIINLIKKYTNPNKIQKNTVINIILKKDEKKDIQKLHSMILPITKTINIEVTKDHENKLISNKIVTKAFKKIVLRDGIIKNSLYAAAMKEKIEPNIIIEFARIYGFEIDFQRDIRVEDKFRILYEKFYDENDEFIKSGSILYAFMSVNGNEIALYKFGSDKNYGYFDMNGKSIEKTLMKTPINGARLSSSFGLRKHPILGFNKMHKGTDFAAPSGTPIMASGTGTITKASWCGGGGNCIKIKHNSTYQTVYAHLKNFARGIKVGKKVKQGQIIGYVGSTGMSTGPHLHYEVLINGKQVNSQTLKLPSGKILKKDERKKFEVHRIKTDVLISETLAKN